MTNLVFQASVWNKASVDMNEAGADWSRQTRDVRNEVLYQKNAPQASNSLVDQEIVPRVWDKELRWYELIGNLTTKFTSDAAKLDQTAKAYAASEQEAEESARFWSWK